MTDQQSSDEPCCETSLNNIADADNNGKRRDGSRSSSSSSSSVVDVNFEEEERDSMIVTMVAKCGDFLLGVTRDGQSTSSSDFLIF